MIFFLFSESASQKEVLRFKFIWVPEIILCTKSTIPEQAALVRAVQRARRKNIPANPKSLNDLGIPDMYRKTLLGDRSCCTIPERMVLINLPRKKNRKMYLKRRPANRKHDVSLCLSPTRTSSYCTRARYGLLTKRLERLRRYLHKS